MFSSRYRDRQEGDMTQAAAVADPWPKAVLFDAYGTLFDVHAVVACSEQLFPGQGVALSQLWRQKQIEYTQLRTLCGPAGEHYRNFWEITLDGLRYAAERLQLPLTAAHEKRLMDEYACLSAFPDTLPVLRELRSTGVALGILSNGTPDMLDIGLKSAGMSELFQHVLSVDAVRLYKTSAAAYALGPAACGAEAREIVFVSSNGWDVCGATWYGYATFWVNRAGLPPEQLGVTPRGQGRSMAELMPFLRSGWQGASAAG